MTFTSDEADKKYAALVTSGKAKIVPSAGLKHDSSKPDYSLLSSLAIDSLAQVLTFGKAKYAAHNWRNGISFSRLLAAALRHIFAYLKGENKDPESGLPHLAHAMCCLMFALELAETKPELDDRYPVVVPVSSPVP